MESTQDINVIGVRRLVPPRSLKEEYPMTAAANRAVVDSRETIRRILTGEDPRMLVAVGPCSIHDPEGALEFASKLSKLREALSEHFYLVMRVYFEKPRTTVGWKGLINDPHLDGSNDIEFGLARARKLLREIVGMGLPAVTEFLDPIVPQYIADLVSWAAIGARTTESQTHRQMASGLSMPIGYKNGTDGSLQVAIDAMTAARHSHHFLGIDQEGVTSIVETRGNPWGHIVLRGGHKRPNFDEESIHDTQQRLEQAGLPSVVMVDCSHANSFKKPARQEAAWQSVIQQRLNGNTGLIGLMLESYLKEGKQSIPSDVSALEYGVSVTDACLGWDATEQLLRQGHEAFVQGRMPTGSPVSVM